MPPVESLCHGIVFPSALVAAPMSGRDAPLCPLLFSNMPVLRFTRETKKPKLEVASSPVRLRNLIFRRARGRADAAAPRVRRRHRLLLRLCSEPAPLPLLRARLRLGLINLSNSDGVPLPAAVPIVLLDTIPLSSCYCLVYNIMIPTRRPSPHTGGSFYLLYIGTPYTPYGPPASGST